MEDWMHGDEKSPLKDWDTGTPYAIVLGDSEIVARVYGKNCKERARMISFVPKIRDMMDKIWAVCEHDENWGENNPELCQEISDFINGVIGYVDYGGIHEQ